MARAPYKVEMESEFNRLAAEEAGHQDLTEYYKSLLTGASQTAQKYAQEQASYDISGAYANYLKQQRNIASQGRLESGYKEEVGDVLKQQYQSAYSQAKKTAQDLYSDIYGELSKAATEQIESIKKQSETKANLANAMIEQAQLSGDTTYEWFTVDKEGKTQLSDWGYDQMSKYLMSGEYDFGKYLQDKNLKDELKYYLSDPTGARKEFFGITETKYDPTSQESIGRRLRTTTITEEGETISYIDTIEKPTVDFNWNDFADEDFGEKGHNKMVDSAPKVVDYAMNKLGLTEKEIKTILGFDNSPKPLEELMRLGLARVGYDISSKPSEKRHPKQEYEAFINKFVQASKSKYIKE